MSPSSLALSNLRAIVIVIVLGFHSMLAYLVWIPVAATTDFSSPPYAWRAFPIIDDHRFFGFDLFCAWQDVYLMALMFFLSGLFVWPSLTRKKDWGFLRDRMLRLGLPFVFGIFVLIPLAVYPAYRVTAADPSVSAYLDAWLALPFWSNGPLWFLWQLLALNVIVAGLHWLAPSVIDALGRWSAPAHFTRYFIVLLAVSALAYVPLGRRIHAVDVVRFRFLQRAVLPAAALRRLLLCRRRLRRCGHRTRCRQRRRDFGPALGALARRRAGFAVSLDGAHRFDDERSGVCCRRGRRRSQFRVGLCDRLFFPDRRQPAFRHHTFAAAR
jgi:hypothetical protein